MYEVRQLANKNALQQWSIDDSAELYGIRNWGAGYFDITENGDVAIHPFGRGSNVAVSIPEVIRELKERGLELPVLLRIENILDSQISSLHNSFRDAISTLEYKGEYRGVFPIKVNQQQQVLEEIANFGSSFHHGFEVGSKAELIAAISQMRDHKACLVCNGYKDEEFIDLGLHAMRMGFNCIFVMEMGWELSTLLERAALLGVEPQIGVRVKLSAQGGGHWTASGGERSSFGLSMSQITDIIDTLKAQDKLHCLKLLHYHLGSQIPNIRSIRSAVQEASRVYAELVKEGAPMGYIDLGGGLAVDYDGSHTNYVSSRNYSVNEYAMDVVEAVMTTLDKQDIPHPHIITESGRAVVAYYSVLLFNILDVSKIEDGCVPEEIPEDTPEAIANMYEAYKSLTLRNLQEAYNDALFYRDEVRRMFLDGRVNLRQRTLADNLFWAITKAVAKLKDKLKIVPKELEEIDTALADIYYANFSVFQSLPDAWAIDQLFPLMPLHRLKEEPTRHAIISDITCDSDGKLDTFIDPKGEKPLLDLHPMKNGDEYYLGAFLVGAYQETLGDLHNLFGDTNVVSVRMYEDGSYEFVREIEGDTVGELLEYVEYDQRRIMEDLRSMAEQAVREGRITAAERYDLLQAFYAGLRGYTYFER
ncbi:biosynthetic arginine decarboxylase [Halodesulfovibrio spirochaetisodalis]|uniref:biosynthetic arginine decarboxylase n=1 Tax=Halodesulfovibrio spirochaetisodalis TaxID=1560234 RepID=UPI0008301277|nr:biosynthetic arginine decarboxylase [Halodesulfovibrio spirochaetisodalis]